jgi:hypothetical protein
MTIKCGCGQPCNHPDDWEIESSWAKGPEHVLIKEWMAAHETRKIYFRTASYLEKNIWHSLVRFAFEKGRESMKSEKNDVIRCANCIGKNCELEHWSGSRYDPGNMFHHKMPFVGSASICKCGCTKPVPRR